MRNKDQGFGDLQNIIKIKTSQDNYYITDTGVVGDSLRIMKAEDIIKRNQMWIVSAKDMGDPYTTFSFINVATGNAITLDKYSNKKNEKIIAAPFTDMLTQLWYVSTLIDNVPSRFYFLNAFSGLCITVQDNHFNQGQPLIMYPYEGSQDNYNYLIEVVDGI